MKNKTDEALDAAREAEWSKFRREDQDYGPNTAFLKGFDKGFDVGFAHAESQGDFKLQLAYESGYKAAESQGGWGTPEAKAFTVDDIKSLGFPNNIGTCPLCSNTVSVMLQEGDQIAECNDCSFSVDLRDYYGLPFES